MSHYIVIGMVVLALTACARNNPGSATNTKGLVVQNVKTTNGTEGEIIGTPAPGSKFSKIRIGMPMKQVFDLIGQPNDTGSHITGKQFIPFYFGGDTHRIETFYKNEGQLAFAPSHFAGMANVLVKIEVNRSENGYAR